MLRWDHKIIDLGMLMEVDSATNFNTERLAQQFTKPTRPQRSCVTPGGSIESRGSLVTNPW